MRGWFCEYYLLTCLVPSWLNVRWQNPKHKFNTKANHQKESSAGYSLFHYSLQAAGSEFRTRGKNIFGPSRKVGLAKHLYTKLERLTLSCRVTGVWSEKLNLYNWQIMVLQFGLGRGQYIWLLGQSAHPHLPPNTSPTKNPLRRQQP